MSSPAVLSHLFFFTGTARHAIRGHRPSITVGPIGAFVWGISFFSPGVTVFYYLAYLHDIDPPPPITTLRSMTPRCMMQTTRNNLSPSVLTSRMGRL